MNKESFQFLADDQGFYGDFGGAYIPEMLVPSVNQLVNEYPGIIRSEDFQDEFNTLLKDYVGRPTPLYLAKNLSDKYNYQVYLKREDLNHTGAHKINNAIGQALLAKRLGKKRIIAETGAGQHGVATATACALLGLDCDVFMGEVDIERQAANVQRMKLLGARIVPATSGSKTLKDATNEAIKDWIATSKESHYIIGSAVGPHPFPEMVAIFQSVISKEIKTQFFEKNNCLPDAILACVGGGSNAIGAFYDFIPEEAVRLIAIEAAGEGVDTDKTAASITKGTIGILHGSKSLILQDEDGQIEEAHSVSAGLDYPGSGPQHAYLKSTGRAEYLAVTDDQALQAVKEVSRLEGIIPALESAHAFAILDRLDLAAGSNLVICLSGRGDKDLNTYLEKISLEN